MGINFRPLLRTNQHLFRCSGDKPKDPAVFRGDVPKEPDWHTMPIRERHPHLPSAASELVRQAGRPVIDQKIPLIQSPHFRDVTVVVGGRRIVFKDFNQTHFKIGRAGNNHLVLSGAQGLKQVSRRHAALYLKDGQAFFRDTSKNGSQVDGTKYLYAHHHFRLDPPISLKINHSLNLRVSFDVGGNVTIEVLNHDQARFALKRRPENQDGYYFTPAPPQDLAKDATVTRIIWPDASKADGFREGKKVSENEIIDLPSD